MALPYDFTCTGCSNKCTIKVPKFYTMALPEIPALPALPPLDPQELIEYLKSMIPKIPAIPAIPDFSFAYGGLLPSWDNPTWKPDFTYTKGTKIDVDKPIPPDAKGERKTVLTYQALGDGKSLNTAPVWGMEEITDGENATEFTWKLIFTNKGTPGNCPLSSSDKK